MYIISVLIGSNISDSKSIMIGIASSRKEAKEVVENDFKEVKQNYDDNYLYIKYNKNIDDINHRWKYKMFSSYPIPEDTTMYISFYLSESGDESYIKFDNGLQVKYFINYIPEEQ